MPSKKPGLVPITEVPLPPIKHKKVKVTYTFKEKLSNGGVRTTVEEEEIKDKDA